MTSFALVRTCARFQRCGAAANGKDYQDSNYRIVRESSRGFVGKTRESSRGKTRESSRG